ncbi:hypothetical protein PG993_011962 [Apiospora rasikravindrae]|uniref:Uncharacterized protein n=1 Tax=Apiospora rasikravindrae TaxID=990691 RepID=A0ABR1S143_9PEZI
MSNHGPLPTPFVTSPACKTQMTSVYQYERFLLQGPPLGHMRCMPDKYVPSTDHYYSPYSVCPSGYTSACQTINAIGTLTETWIACCPTQKKFTCMMSPLTSHQYTLGCESTLPGAGWTLTSVKAIDSKGATSVMCTHTGTAGGAVNAYSVQLRYVAARNASPTATITPTPDPSPGLSTGAAVGIGIGCTVAFVAIVTVAAFFLMWRRRRQRQEQGAEPGPLSASPEPEPHGGPHAPYPPPTEVALDQQYIRAPGYELDATQPKLELYVGQHNTAEMPAIRA